MNDRFFIKKIDLFFFVCPLISQNKTTKHTFVPQSVSETIQYLFTFLKYILYHYMYVKFEILILHRIAAWYWSSKKGRCQGLILHSGRINKDFESDKTLNTMSFFNLLWKILEVTKSLWNSEIVLKMGLIMPSLTCYLKIKWLSNPQSNLVC